MSVIDETVFDEDDIINRLITIEKLHVEKNNTRVQIQRINQDFRDKILNELNNDPTPCVARLLIMIGYAIPIYTGLLNKVRETATGEELEVLKKYGIKI